MEYTMNNGFAELNASEMDDINGGALPLIVGALAAGGIVVGTGVVVCGTVYAVGKAVQWVGDKITG